MATQKRTDKIVEISGMSVAGGSLSLGNGLKYYVNCRLDYSNVSFEDAIELASGGSSVRVQAQAKLRADEATLKKSGVVADAYSPAIQVQVDKMPWITFDVATDFESEGRGPRDPQKVATSAFSKMNREQKVLFIMDSMKMDRETAENLVKD